MVVFVDPKQSYIEIIQNIGRICRKKEKLATVLIPCYIDINKYKECNNNEQRDNFIRSEMSNTGDFNGILNVLTALRQENPYIFELCLNNPNIYTKKELKDNFKKYDVELNEEELELEENYFIKLSEKENKNIIITHQKISEEDIIINKCKGKTIYFVKTENNKFMKVIGDINQINRPNRNINPSFRMNNELKILWEFENDFECKNNIFGGFIKSTIILDDEEKWKNTLDEVKKYIDINNKRPSTNDIDKYIIKLGEWLSYQIKKYKNNEYIMKNISIKKLWEGFIENYKIYFQSNEELWLNNLRNLKNYLIENNKRPSRNYKNRDIRSLNLWESNQINNYRKNIMKDENKKLWEEFIEKYKIYYISNNETWIFNLKKLEEYLIEYNKKPYEYKNNNNNNKKIKKLITWLNHQQYNYKMNIQIMKDKNIRKLWEEFIEKYKIYFEYNIELWLNNLKKIEDYIIKYNKKPSEKDLDDDIKKLSRWISNQQTNYKINIQIMKDENIRKLWEEFIEKYKIYFEYNIELWLNNLKKIEDYIIKYNKKPSEKDLEENIKKLSRWISNQQTNYKMNIHIMKNENIRKLWEEFIEKYKTYIQINNKKIEIKEPKEENISKSIIINRPEQSKLRKYLIENREKKCIICIISKSINLLITAHLIPRYKIDKKTKYDPNIVEFMCQDCHKLYDIGEIGVYNGKLCIRDIYEYPQYKELQNTEIKCYNNFNKKYFDKHYETIYLKDINTENNGVVV